MVAELDHVTKRFGDRTIVRDFSPPYLRGGRIGPEAYLPAAQELGADRVFSKPFDVRELAGAVKEVLENG